MPPSASGHAIISLDLTTKNNVGVNQVNINPYRLIIITSCIILSLYPNLFFKVIAKFILSNVLNNKTNFFDINHIYLKYSDFQIIPVLSVVSVSPTPSNKSLKFESLPEKELEIYP